MFDFFYMITATSSLTTTNSFSPHFICPSHGLKDIIHLVGGENFFSAVTLQEKHVAFSRAILRESSHEVTLVLLSCQCGNHTVTPQVTMVFL